MTTTTPSPDVPIESYLCLALYRASRAVTGLYRELLDELGLTYPQYLVMRLLWQRGPLNVKDIGRALDLDYGTLSPLLKRLEAADLVRRTRRRDDERAVDVALTTAGQEMRISAEHIPTNLTCAMGLDDDTSNELRNALEQLTATVSGATSA